MIGPVEAFANGVEVVQVTADAAIKCNIYCEFPWCPPDSSCFVFQRRTAADPKAGVDYVACRFGSWEQRLIGRGHGATMANGGRFYFRRTSSAGQAEYVGFDLQKWEERVIPLPPGVPLRGRLDISVGERYLAYQVAASYQPQRFQIWLLDLCTGATRLLHEDPFIYNPHHQFEPATGNYLMIQHNRGCRIRTDGGYDVLVGPEGCTLFLLTIPDGQVIRLPIGPPHTPTLSGHETWIGSSGQLLATLNLDEDYDFGKGPIAVVGPQDAAARLVCAPWQMNHIGMEPSGRLFCADAFKPDQIILGSPHNGKVAEICPARTSYRRAAMDTHPHAYVTPDLRWVVFNSDRLQPGVNQIYAAAIPPSLTTALL